MVSLLSYRLSGQVLYCTSASIFSVSLSCCEEQRRKKSVGRQRRAVRRILFRFLPCLKERKKENCQAKGGMGGRHAATTQVFCRRALSRPSSVL